MSKNPVSPFFSQRFHPIVTPAAPGHSRQSVPTHENSDEEMAHGMPGFQAHMPGCTNVHASRSHSGNKSYVYSHSTSAPHLSSTESTGYLHSTSAPQLHTRNSDQSIFSPSEPSSWQGNSKLEKHSSTMAASNTGFSAVITGSPSDAGDYRKLRLSVIDEDGYDEKSINKPSQASPCGEQDVQLGWKESAGDTGSAKKFSKLEEQRRLLQKDLDDMYPWRQKMPTCTSSGSTFIQHETVNASSTTEKHCIQLNPLPSPLMSVGKRDLEYSMEPRNFSRGPSRPLLKAVPVVAPPLDSQETIDVPFGMDNSSATCTMASAVSTNGDTKVNAIYDELLPLPTKHQEPVSTDRQLITKGSESIYDQLTPLPKKDRDLHATGVGLNHSDAPSQVNSDSRYMYYDELLPLSTRYQPPPSTVSQGATSGRKVVQRRHSAASGPVPAHLARPLPAPLTPPLPVRRAADSTSAAHPRTYCHPHRSKLSAPATPNAGTNPNPVVGAQRREQRCSVATPSGAEVDWGAGEVTVVRQAPHPSKSKLGPPARPVSYAGTQESLGWNFVAGGESHGAPYTQSGYKMDKSRWARIFGGEKVVHDLFNPRKAHKVKKYLMIPGTRINAVNSVGDAPLHCYIKSDRPDKLDLLATFLVHCNCKVLQIDKPDVEGKSPLHVAVEMNDIWAAKVLIAFGADMNCPNRFRDTPLDLVSHAFEQGEHHEIHEMLTRLHAMPGGGLSPTESYTLQPLNESLNSITNESYDIEESQKLGTYLDEKRHTAFVFKLEELLSKQNLEFSVNTNVSLPPGMVDNHGTFFDPMIARQNQLLRIHEWKSTVEFKKGSGSRMLFLDGGGIRGLIEIEALERIESLTGRRITELFDWIIGTSTGGILALCLVYLGMTLGELRQLYFRLREEVFVGGMLSTSRKSDALESLLQQQFGDKCMAEVDFPKVLITAVSTKTNPPQLNFFNNCFGDEFSTQLVWKVARYTSAAPMYFTECDSYMDGGVLANNPSLAAWTVIQTYHDNRHFTRPKVAMAVSLGTGVYPSQKLGETDILGKGLLNLRGTMKRAQRFIRMISTALVESESVASTFHTTCKALDVKFFRFSPILPSVIDPDETDIKVLVDMLIHTKQYLSCQDSKRSLDEMVRLFQHISEVSRGLNLEKT